MESLVRTCSEGSSRLTGRSCFGKGVPELWRLRVGLGETGRDSPGSAGEGPPEVLWVSQSDVRGSPRGELPSFVLRDSQAQLSNFAAPSPLCTRLGVSTATHPNPVATACPKAPPQPNLPPHPRAPTGCSRNRRASSHSPRPMEGGG